MRIFFLLLASVCLVRNSSVTGSVDGTSPSDNVIGDFELSTNKSSRIVNQSPNELFYPGSNSLTPVNAAIFKVMLLPTLTFIVSTLIKSKLAIAHLLFGALFGVIATVATCNFTPVCRITAGSEVLTPERIMELMSPENLGALTVLMNNAIDTYEAVRKLN